MDLAERTDGSGRHPWELARSRFFRTVIDGAARLAPGCAVLDVGAGDGWFAGELQPHLPPDATIVCWDINYQPDDLGSPVPDGLQRVIDRPDGPFDLVLVLDVLEHVEDDEGFLRDGIAPLLAPSGALVVSVPVHPVLFSDHDDMLGHVRRYRPHQISALLRRHVEVRREGALFSSLVPARAAQVLLERAGRHTEQRGVGAWRRGPLVTRVVQGVLDADAALGYRSAGRRLAPPGLSYWAACAPRGD